MPPKSLGKNIKLPFLKPFFFRAKMFFIFLNIIDEVGKMAQPHRCFTNLSQEKENREKDM